MNPQLLSQLFTAVQRRKYRDVGSGPPAPAPSPPAAPGVLATDFTLTSPNTNAATPFTLGYAIAQGDVPSGEGIVVTGATAQAKIRNAWPDGSAKFAVISGIANLTAATPLTVTLSSGSASSGSALTTTELKATGITAAIDAGAFGNVSWATTDWDSPAQTPVSGHRMSSWVYRKQIGSDPHLVGWLEVNLFLTGTGTYAVEVLPWIENGYLNVASPVNKSAIYTFTLGGTQRYTSTTALDIPNHCRTVLINGAALSYWLGTDPAVTVKHNRAYFMSTEVVPTYFASVAAGAGAVTGLPSTFAPFQQGSYRATMSDGAYHPSIGLLPEWDVLYLTSTAASVWSALQRNAYSAGRYGIHHRDETTQKPLRFSSYPTTVIGGGFGITAGGASSTSTYTPTATGTSPQQWDVAHHPSVGYMAYLVTGRHYFLEQVQFAATANYLNGSTAPRENGNGVFASWSALQTRGAAWGFRTLLQAATITPDSDSTLRTEFVNAVTNNINTHHALYVAQANNAFGWVKPDGDDNTYGSGADGKFIHSTWVQDFFTGAYGYALCLELVTGTPKTKLQEFFAWKAKSVVGRLGGLLSTDYNYRDAAQYTINMAPSNTPDFDTGTGPWYADWGALYLAQLGVANPGTTGALNGTIEITSYWGNMQPAIAYAVRHNVVGAQTAYARIMNASNWPTMKTEADTAPVWSVAPAPIPSWVASNATWAWFDVPSSNLSAAPPTTTDVTGATGPKFKTDGYNGMALKRRGSRLMQGRNGGHNDYYGNEVNAIWLNRETVAGWIEVKAGTPLASTYNEAAVYADRRPAATHTYYAQVFIDTVNKLLFGPASGLLTPPGATPDAPPGWPSFQSDKYVAAFDFTVRDWLLDTDPNSPTNYPDTSTNSDFTAQLIAKHPITEEVYISRYQSNFFWKYNAVTDVWTQLAATYDTGYCAAAIDPVRSRMLVVGDFNGTADPRVRDLNGNLVGGIVFGGLGPTVLRLQQPRVLYDEALDAFLVLYNTSGSYAEFINILRVDAATFAVSQPTITGTPPFNNKNGVRGHPQYVPELRGVVMHRGGDSDASTGYTGNLKMLRTSL